MARFWTAERVRTLTEMMSGGATASEIAREVGDGCTRNAVIGCAWRLGLDKFTPDTAAAQRLRSERNRHRRRRYHAAVKVALPRTDVSDRPF